MENKQRVARGLGEKGWVKWVRGTKESTPEIIVAPCATTWMRIKKINLDVN